VDDFSVFADISVVKTSSSRNELDDYLAAPCENTKTPLQWWWEKRRVYPTLAQMALDYLSIPGERCLL
jgi:hypothetical protein